MRSLSLVLAAALLLPGITRGQTFERHYPLPANTVLRGSSATPDGGLVLCGQSDGAGYLLRLDAAGNVSWVRLMDVIGTNMAGTFGEPWTSNLYDAVALPDGSILTVGGGDMLNNPISATKKLVLVQDPLAGGLQGHSSRVYVHSQVYTAAALGPEAVWATGACGHLGSTSASLHKLDPATGDLEGAYDLTGGGATPASYPVGTAVVAIPDGGAVFAGSGFDGFIARVDADLSLLWTRTWDGTSTPAMAAGTDAFYLAGGLGGGEQLLIKVDLAGNEVWVKRIEMEDGVIRSVLVRPDGNVLVAGDAAGNDAHGWAALLAPDGTLLWCKRYGAVGDAVVLAIAENTAAGTRLIGTIGPDLLVLAIDADGELGTCTTPDLACTMTDYALASGTGVTESFAENGIGPITATATQALMSSDLTCASGGAWSASGVYFRDTNGDGIRDAGEPGLPWLSVVLDPEGHCVSTGDDGSYSIGSVLLGDHSVSAPPPPAFWGLTTPASYDITVEEGGATSFPDLDFGVTALVDTTVVVASAVLGQGVCAAQVPLHMSILNQGTTTPSGSIALTLDPLCSFVNASVAPDSIVGGTFYWAFAALALGSSQQWTVMVTSPGSSNIGSPYHHLLQVFGDGHALPITQDSVGGVVACAYDPNDKAVEPRGHGELGAIATDTEWMTYTVRFQNTGTAAAQSVRIEDALSPTLDARTVQVIATSHPLTRADITAGGIVSFLFEGIQLSDSGTSQPGSQGYVRFRVRPLPGLDHLTFLSNTAHIFFDLEPAVVTNTVRNVFIDCEQAPWQPIAMGSEEELMAYGYNFMDTMTYTYQWYLDGEPVDGATSNMLQPTVAGIYTVTITDEVGCMKMPEPLTIVVTDVVLISASHIGIVPNPFTNSARLMSDVALSATTAIELIDVTGKAARRFTGNGSREIVIDADGLASGLYLVRVSNPDRVIGTARVVVE